MPIGTFERALKPLLLVALVALTSSLVAASVTFSSFDAKTKSYDQTTIYGDVVDWSFAGGVKIKYSFEGKDVSKSIARKDVVSATLVDNLDYSDALRKAMESGDVKDFESVANDGRSSAAQKDFAAWQIANMRAVTNATTITAMNAYLNTWKTGNFVRDAYIRVALASSGAAFVTAANSLISLGDEGSKAEGNLMLGRYYFDNKRNDEAKAAFTAALSAGTAAFRPDAIAQANTYLGRLTGEKKYYEASVAIDARLWMDLSGRDLSRGYAFKGIGDLAAASGDNNAAYDAFVKASFWLGPYGAVEGECIFGAYTAAGKLAGADKKWEARRDTLKSVLEESYPNLLK